MRKKALLPASKTALGTKHRTDHLAEAALRTTSYSTIRRVQNWLHTCMGPSKTQIAFDMRLVGVELASCCLTGKADRDSLRRLCKAAALAAKAEHLTT